MSVCRRQGRAGHGVTMREVGQIAGGFHHATVSKALRNDPSISESTRGVIQRTARKLGYRRDPLLDALIRHRLEKTERRAPRVIALIGEAATRSELEASPGGAALWCGAVAAAQRLGHQIEYFPHGVGQMTARRLDAVLYARGIRGVILGPLAADGPRPTLSWERLSAVKIEGGHLEAPRCTVAPALLRGVKDAFGRLWREGRRRIGLAIRVDSDVLRRAQLKAGFLFAQQACDAAETVPVLEVGGRDAVEVIQQWLRRHRPEVVLAESAVWRTIAAAAGQTRRRSPEWIGIGPAEAMCGRPGLVLEYERLGATAAEQVIGLMQTFQRDAEQETTTTYIAVTWRDGAPSRA